MDRLLNHDIQDGECRAFLQFLTDLKGAAQYQRWYELYGVTAEVDPAHKMVDLAYHGIFPRPFACSLLIALPVCFVDVGNLWHQRVVWVWVCK